MLKKYIPLFLLMSVIALAGCGQKGDLYHTEDAPPPELENPDG